MIIPVPLRHGRYLSAIVTITVAVIIWYKSVRVFGMRHCRIVDKMLDRLDLVSGCTA